MRVLALDPATMTGFAVFTVSDSGIAIEKVGALKVDNKTSVYEGDWCLSLVAQLRELMDPLPDRCYVEDFFFSKRTCNGASLNAYLRAAVFMLLRECGVPYTKFTPTHWQRFICGTTKRGRGSDTKQAVLDALREKFSITFSERITMNGRSVKFKHDISDAVGIGLYGIHADALTPCNTVSWVAQD